MATLQLWTSPFVHHPFIPARAEMPDSARLPLKLLAFHSNPPSLPPPRSASLCPSTIKAVLSLAFFILLRPVLVLRTSTASP